MTTSARIVRITGLDRPATHTRTRTQDSEGVLTIARAISEALDGEPINLREFALAVSAVGADPATMLALFVSAGVLVHCGPASVKFGPVGMALATSAYIGSLE